MPTAAPAAPAPPLRHVPPPRGSVLSDEALVARARRGDGGCLNLVLQRYRGFVRGRAAGYFLAGADPEDVVQEGMIGLYKAIRDYDARRAASFRTFADLCVKRQILSAVKSATRRKHVPLNSYVSLSAPAGDGDDGEREVVEQLVSLLDDPVERLVDRQDFNRLRAYCAKALSPLEVLVLERYVDGESYAEIAASVGRSSKTIDNAVQRIKRKLGCYLESGRLAEAG